MCTRMDQKYRSLRGCLERVDESFKVETDRFGIVVGILDRFDPNISENSKVVDFGKLDQLCCWVDSCLAATYSK